MPTFLFICCVGLPIILGIQDDGEVANTLIGPLFSHPIRHPLIHTIIASGISCSRLGMGRFRLMARLTFGCTTTSLRPLCCGFGPVVACFLLVHLIQ